ncbi:taurine catabolism dioxygenase TauD [Amphritea opalescens]|uniref:Taurine catabolism dioxygenase TauD n=1 Tax=Amphritea opalescens TaxID=2490544 RepID=A0A430KPG1_9GAMM|nr:TauD/TfdA family dioxygenase [Amphritea opalescens]RTE65352.1 taurine catabolism dioxygenase TauD [Amphritea opalescens]
MSEKLTGKPKKVMRLPLGSTLIGRTHAFVQIDIKQIRNSGYQIIRNFGTDVQEFEKVFDHISSSQLYYSERIGSVCHQYHVEVSSNNLSQQMRTGGFHSDFMFQEHPPEYIALLCLQTDPKHPFYGRNQVVAMSPLIQRLHEGFSLSLEALLERQLPYHFTNGQHFNLPLLSNIHGQLQFKYHQHLVTENKATSTYIAQLHAAMIDVAEDVCLNLGDVLILSNHHALHRRGECTVSHDSTKNVWNSRKMASIRFNL